MQWYSVALGTRTLLDVLDAFVSTKDVEGVSIEHTSEAIEDGFVPAKTESRPFVVGEGSVGGGECFVKPPTAVQRVDGVRFECDDVRCRGGRVVGFGCGTPDNREKAGGCGVDESEAGSQEENDDVCREHRISVSYVEERVEKSGKKKVGKKNSEKKTGKARGVWGYREA